MRCYTRDDIPFYHAAREDHANQVPRAFSNPSRTRPATAWQETGEPIVRLPRMSPACGGVDS
jgi:hypothetical protein